MVKKEATFLCLQSKSSTESKHRNCGTNRVSGKKSLTISKYSYKKYRTCIYIFLQYNETKQIKKNKEYISTIIEGLAVCISGILNVIRRYLTEMLISAWNVKCHRIKLNVK